MPAHATTGNARGDGDRRYGRHHRIRRRTSRRRGWRPGRPSAGDADHQRRGSGRRQHRLVRRFLARHAGRHARLGGVPDADLIADLRHVLAVDRVRSAALDLTLYGRDASLYDGGRAAVVCFPLSTDEVQACVRIARQHGRPFVARGSGTGLAGGAVPVGDPVVIVTTKMNRILEIDVDGRVAWVEPGVINLDLTRALAPYGLHFAPDPSSQQACSIGGNVANNSGGPHCLAYGVTSSHVLALEVVLPDASVAMLGGLDADPLGYDLRGVFVGSEGKLGIATRIAVRLTPNPPAVRTMLLDFESVDDAAAAVSEIIAAGIVPAALEMIEGRLIGAVEDFAHAGLPVDAAAVLLVEVDGLPGAVDRATAVVSSVGAEHGARAVRIAADHELVVLNVFHAGDGNLHPLLVFDSREPGVLERVHAAGGEIVAASIAAGGVLSGEHGIGLEKRDYMALLFSADDLDAQARLRDAFDPDGVANPQKVLPAGARCGDLQRIPEGLWV